MTEAGKTELSPQIFNPVALTIAGSDPSGGAGIQADLKTFHQFGVYGTTVIAVLTVQNTLRVSAMKPLPASLVLAQLNAVLEDLPPGAAKTGALGSRENVEAIAERASRFSFPLVVDPVIMSKHGKPMLKEDASVALIQKLLPEAFLVTPNIPEAIFLSGIDITSPESMEKAARAIGEMGPQAVLIKGGHLERNATDMLLYQRRIHTFSGPKIESDDTHGTGCTHSAAITALLAKGVGLIAAVEQAKDFITRAIQTSPRLGRGIGPINHFTPV
ncbi:MAG: bifunctional hydroxymethylpyrimidine kinase/phosphomethylpyrimidine kinase [Acidobacteria bacterium]|nr:bifunctional hydroxymethylpyrimidine kinase/phosphomethylpyrimidine kinase [Acidobacteriota bacterium]